MSSDGPRRVLPVSRRARVLEALRHRGTVRIADLVDELGVSAITLRRDIAQLAGEGLLRRVHGGATLLDGPSPGGPHLAREDDAAPSPARGAPSDVGALGMLVPSLHYYWPGVVRGAEQEAQARGLRLVLRGSSYSGDDESPHLERLARLPGIGGLLVAPNLDGPGTAATLDWLAHSPVPVVLLERTASTGGGHEVHESVVTDHRLGAATAVRHLATLGHRRVAVACTVASPTSRHVLAGWRDACDEHGLPTDDDLVVALPPQDDHGWEVAVDRLLDHAAATRVTGVLVHSDPDAIGLVQRCQARGVAVPGDLSVVAYDDEVAGLFRPALTAVQPRRGAVGRAAVELLAARIADPDRPVHRVTISPTLEVRESTAPPAVR